MKRIFVALSIIMLALTFVVSHNYVVYAEEDDKVKIAVGLTEEELMTIMNKVKFDFNEKGKIIANIGSNGTGEKILINLMKGFGIVDNYGSGHVLQYGMKIYTLDQDEDIIEEYELSSYSITTDNAILKAVDKEFENIEPGSYTLEDGSVPVLLKLFIYDAEDFNEVVLNIKLQNDGSNHFSVKEIVIDEINGENVNYAKSTEIMTNELHFIKFEDGSNVCTIHYDKLPVYFAVNLEEGGREGTYLVDIDKDNKNILFKWINESKRVGTIKEHENSDEYAQRGVEIAYITDYGFFEEEQPAYDIGEYMFIKGNGLFYYTYRTCDLKNAFNYEMSSIMAPYTQYPNAYVFVREDITQNYLTVYGIEKIDEEPQKAGALEGLLTRFVAVIGDAVLGIIRLIIGNEVTLDKIIFNEYEPTVIDFTKNGNGIFSSALTNLSGFNSLLRNVSLSAYMVAILYIGLNIVLAIDTPRQARYKETVSNWIVGSLLLFFVPMFFRYIPELTNSVVAEIGKSRVILYSYDNVDKNFLVSLGFTAEEADKLIGTSGEDTRTVYVEALTGKKEELIDFHDKLDKSYSDKLKKLKEDISSPVSALVRAEPEFYDYDEEEQKNKTIEVVDSIYKYWMENGFKRIDENEAKNILRDNGFSNYDLAFRLVYTLEDTDIKGTWMELKQTESRISIIDSLTESLKHDLMGEMKALAGSTGRFPYVVAWFVCIYIMIRIICMYYKRVIVLSILMITYPFVALTYPIDKLKDGRAQSMTLWYKEFLVNIIVQIVHAVVYVVLVQTGRELYIADSNNWFAFLFAMCFFFPAERLMRSIVGLEGSSIDTLKSNATSIIAGTAISVSVAKNTWRGANQTWGLTKSGRAARDAKKASQAVAIEKRNKRDKALATRAEQKERLREIRRRQRRRAGRPGYGLVNAASSVRSAAYKVGNVGRKYKKTLRGIQDSKAMKYAGVAFRMARGAAGITYGIANFPTVAGSGAGFGTALLTSVEKGRIIGGFRTYDRTPKKKG